MQRQREGLRRSDDNREIQERNSKRADYAIQRFEQEGIRYIRPSETSDRFLIFADDNVRKFQFYAGTGLILGPYSARGIESMINIAHGEGSLTE